MNRSLARSRAAAFTSWAGDDTAIDDPAPPVEATSGDRAQWSRWEGVLAVEGEMTGDGRLIELNALRWENLPLPLRYVSSDVGAHDGAEVVGLIDGIERGRGGKVHAHGRIDLGSEVGREAERQVREGLSTGVSVDLDDVTFEVRVSADMAERHRELVDGESVEAETDADGNPIVHSASPDDEVMVTTDGRVRAATLVSIPAFASARIGVVDEDEEDDEVGPDDEDIDTPDEDEPSDEPLDADSAGDGEGQETDGEVPEDGEDEAVSEQIDADEQDDDVDLEDDSELDDEDKELLAVALASARRDGFANWVEKAGGLPRYIKRIAKHLKRKGMTESHAIASAVNTVKRWCRGGDNVKADTRTKACAAVAEWEAKKAKSKVSSSRSSIVAASAPTRPPREWFDDPGLTGPTPLRIDSEGRVYGHLATWGTCHTAHRDRCVTAPHSATGYSYFHVGTLLTAEGEDVAVGRITMDTGHAGVSLNAASTLAHYDNTGLAVMDVRAGEDSHGIWLAGALRPGLSDERLRSIRSAPLSGDWRNIGGNLELVAALAVNSPGFPVPHPQGMVASGRQMSLVASSGILEVPAPESGPEIIDPKWTGGALPNDVTRELTRMARDSQRQRVERMARQVRAATLESRAKRQTAFSARTHTTRKEK